MARLFPKNVQFILADAVRQEVGGKLTMLGLYSGDVVLLNETLPPALPEGAAGMALAGLTFLVRVLDGQGQFKYRVDLYGPKGEMLGQRMTEQILEMQPGTTASLIVPVQPFPIPEFGIYRIVLTLNGRPYEFKFRVGHVDPTAIFPHKPAEKTAKPAPSRRAPKKAPAKPKKVASRRA